MKKQNPWWWDRYFSPWSKEHNEFIKENSSKITMFVKEMDWDKGVRKVTYSWKGFSKTFEENF